MMQVTKQFKFLDDALWFIDSEGSEAEVYDRPFHADIVYLNRRWKVTIETEAN